MSELELEQISVWAMNVPKNGVVVEFGSLYGRSGVCWAMNCDPSVTIYCVDDFYGDKYDIFLKNTATYKNVIPIRGVSPLEITYPGDKIDVFFMDADHKHPGCLFNLMWWARFVKLGGLLCGHDYHESWPDVITSVQRFKVMNTLQLELYQNTTLWSMLLTRRGQ